MKSGIPDQEIQMDIRVLRRGYIDKCERYIGYTLETAADMLSGKAKTPKEVVEVVRQKVSVLMANGYEGIGLLHEILNGVEASYVSKYTGRVPAEQKDTKV